MPASTPSERQLIARAAAHRSWAITENRHARTAKARDAFLARFENEVDPDRTLPDAERARRAANARKAYFANLARQSARSRRQNSTRRAALDELAEATELLRAIAEATDRHADPPAAAPPEAPTGNQDVKALTTPNSEATR